MENAELELHIVTPTPPTIGAPVLGHLIVIQNPNPTWVPSVFSFFDVSQHAQLVRQLAVTTHEHILLDNLLRASGVYEQCAVTPITWFCSAWWHSYHFHLQEPLAGRSGYGIIGHMRTTVSFFASQQVSPDTSTFLQTFTKKGEERLTDDLVAHDHWPSPSQKALTLLPGCFRMAELPNYIELFADVSIDAIQRELGLWGLQCRIHLLFEHDIVICFPAQLPTTDWEIVYIFLPLQMVCSVHIILQPLENRPARLNICTPYTPLHITKR